MWYVPNPIVETSVPIPTKFAFAFELKVDLWVIDLILASAFAPTPLPPVIVIWGTSIYPNPGSITLISVKLPSMEQYPVAPDPTLSYIDRIGGLIIS